MYSNSALFYPEEQDISEMYSWQKCINQYFTGDLRSGHIQIQGLITFPFV